MITRYKSERGILEAKRRPPTRTHRQMVEVWKKDPEFKAVFDDLEAEFTLLRDLLAARRKAGPVPHNL